MKVLSDFRSFRTFRLSSLYCDHKTSKMAENKSTSSIFSKDNYIWMLVGLVVMAIGMFLLAGGKSEDPSKFNPDEVYSTLRITVAPIVILAGLVIEIFAIFRKPKA